MSPAAGPPTTRDVAPPFAAVRVVETFDDHEVSRPAPAPACIGRFALIEQVGRGGMGVVYAAWDPQLDRKVAIKLVDDARISDTDDARTRLEQEARAAATLNHPNIVTIYDVGVHDGRVFLAMEYVAGCTLRAWMRRTTRPWREVVAMFLEVGRGLAAAHAVGLVHRDFKPDNVLLEVDPHDPAVVRRPRIADFGLAYSRDTAEAMSATRSGNRPRHAYDAATPAVAGTPAYMAPEQFDGLDVGPAADQFSFCVALFEGLFGARPFTASKFEVLSMAVHAGEIVVPKDAPVMPRRLLELLRRGLDPEPTARHANIDGLLAELESILHASRRRRRIGVAIVAATIALGLGFRAALAVAPQPCEDAAAPEMLWTAASRDALQSSAGVEHGAAVVAAFDRYAQAFGEKRVAVCEASRVRGEQSDETMRLRMTCLDRMAGRFAGLTSELAAGDASHVDPAAIDARLPDLSACDDVETLAKLTNRLASRSSRSSTEQDAAWVAAVELVERALTRQFLGRSDASEPAMQAAALAAAHDLPGVQARALSILADAAQQSGDAAQAQTLREQALRLAVADGHDDAVAYLVLDAADAAVQDGRAAEAELHLDYFDAFIDRMTDPDARADLETRAEIVRGRLALARGDAAEAERRLVALTLDGLPDLDRRAAWMTLGAAERALGHDAAAEATWRRLLGLVESMRGAAHPDVAAVLNNLALIRLDAGDVADAEALLLRAESILTAAEPGAPLLATIATNRGWAARLGHRPDDARRQLARALELGAHANGARHPSRAYALDQLGELEREAGHLDQAFERFAEAGELRDATLGANHPETVTTLVGMGRVFLDRGEPGQAGSAFEAALRILDAHPGAPRARGKVLALQAIALASADASGRLVARDQHE